MIKIKGVINRLFYLLILKPMLLSDGYYGKWAKIGKCLL